MSKIALTVFVGVFVGSIAWQIIYRRQPELLQRLKDSVEDIQLAFLEGYREESPDVR